MSIWSGIALDSADLWTLGYAPPDATHTLGVSKLIPEGLDIATATPWYGGSGLRLSVVDDEEEAVVVVPRATVVAMRDALTAWLVQTETAEQGHRP